MSLTVVEPARRSPRTEPPDEPRNSGGSPTSLREASANAAVPAPVGTARYGEDDVVHEAARRPRVDEFVDGLLDGWHTELGPGGARLSGGQRQRASIARALLKDAPIESATRARLWRAHEGTGDGRSATGETTKERVR